MKLMRYWLLISASIGFISLHAGAALTNAGFEDAHPTTGWEVTTYGAQPRLELDSTLVKEGKQSLRISASEPSDTALAQEASLEPNRWFRFSAWVRTESLDPMGSRVSATLQVQRPNGSGLIVGGTSHSETMDWTQCEVHFRSPPDGRVRLCLFFVGFGRGTGTVWFDDAQLEPATLENAPIWVTAEPLTSGRISPMQYGQFVEYLCDLVPSMWAEKLSDGSFEGLSPYKFAFISQTDFKEKPWYPSGAVNRGRYSLDKESRISGAVSQKIAVDGQEPCTLGLSQDGIFVEREKGYRFGCWLRAEGLRVPVRVRLHNEGQILATSTFSPSAEWKKFTVLLTPSAKSATATLTLEFRGPGTLWLDNASLMPVETVGGWRPDVVEAVRALKPGIIRFGGSAVDEAAMGDFEWKDTIGDPDRRKPFRAWGGLQPTGPGLEEFVQFCQAVQAEPLICVRFSNRAPNEAAEEVEYFNGSTNTPMGALRLRNGHAQPYHIKYWQIGNERRSAEYDRGVAAFCAAMKAVDPSIRILSSFPTAGSLQNAGAYFDYVCPHHYTPDLEECESDLNFIRRLVQQQSPTRPIKVAVTEWNTTAGDWGLGRAQLMTLANALACSRYHNLLHRQADLVEIANRSNLINSFGSGILQTDNHRLYKTPTYYAQLLYSTLAGDRPLRIDSSLPTNFGLDLSATLDTSRRRVTLFAVNDTAEKITGHLDLSAFGANAHRVSVWSLADRDQAGEPDVRNSFSDPERIQVQTSAFRSKTPQFDYQFPALSLTVLQWPAL